MNTSVCSRRVARKSTSAALLLASCTATEQEIPMRSDAQGSQVLEAKELVVAGDRQVLRDAVYCPKLDEFCVASAAPDGVLLSCSTEGDTWSQMAYPGFSAATILCDANVRSIVLYTDDFDDATGSIRYAGHSNRNGWEEWFLEKKCTRARSQINHFSVQDGAGIIAYEDACGLDCSSTWVAHRLAEIGQIGSQTCLSDPLGLRVGASFQSAHPSKPLFTYSSTFRDVDGFIRARNHVVLLGEDGEVVQAPLTEGRAYFPFGDDSLLIIRRFGEGARTRFRRCGMEGECLTAGSDIVIESFRRVHSLSVNDDFAIMGTRGSENGPIPWAWLFNSSMELEEHGPVHNDARAVGRTESSGALRSLLVGPCSDAPENFCASIEALDW